MAANVPGLIGNDFEGPSEARSCYEGIVQGIDCLDVSFADNAPFWDGRRAYP